MGSAGTFLAVLMLRSQHDRVYAIAANAAASETIDASDDDTALLQEFLSVLIQRFET